MSILGASPSLNRVLDDNRADGCPFGVYQCFDEENLLCCVLQADHDVFGMVSVIFLVEYLVHRLKSALYEEWTEDKLILRKCIRQGSVDFADYRQFLSEVIDMWPSIRTFVGCTGHSDAKEEADTVSYFPFLSFRFSSFSFERLVAVFLCGFLSPFACPVVYSFSDEGD